MNECLLSRVILGFLIHSLAAKVGAQQQEVDTAKANYKKAKSSLDEALTKLDVMTEYFQNKEVDLQRSVLSGTTFLLKRIRAY